AIAKNVSDGYVYFSLAQCYRACDLNDRATEYYEKAINISPDKIQYSKEFAEFISESNKSVEQPAGDGTIKEISLSMDNAQAADAANDRQYKELVLSGDANYKSKNYDESVKNYREALKLKPADEETLLKLGNIYKIKDDNKTALSYYKKSIVVNPNYSDGWFNLGLVYAAEKNNNKAKECFHRVIALNPNYGYAYYALGIAYEQDGNKGEALNNYKIYLTHNPDESTKQTVEQKIKELEQK
ncbi:MAG: tetratricopeptide repeat protein, partial [Candidatus Gastranaerophilales bacterium]|nr:tetratricopeptide repeat protein [Candidatus Gastranaerophilales bacterium]